MQLDEFQRRHNSKKAGFWFFDHDNIVPWAVSFFYSIHARDFLHKLERLLKYEDTAVGDGALLCMFEENFNPVEHELSPEDELSQPFKGVRFSFRHNRFEPLEYDIVDKSTFVEYVRIACDNFVKEYPDRKLEVEQAFQENGMTCKVIPFSKSYFA